MLKADTIRKLGERQQELADLFLDITEWKTLPKPDTKDGRGDGYWQLRYAGIALTLALRCQTMIDVMLRPRGVPYTPDEDDHEAEAARYEKQAVALIEKVRRRRAPG